MSSLYDFEAQSIDGQPVKLEQYRGKPLLIVNTASACGFTPQFGGLEKLHQTYGDRGLVVLGFPCNQFGSQDKGRQTLRTARRAREVGQRHRSAALKTFPRGQNPPGPF